MVAPTHLLKFYTLLFAFFGFSGRSGLFSFQVAISSVLSVPCFFVFSLLCSTLFGFAVSDAPASCFVNEISFPLNP